MQALVHVIEQGALFVVVIGGVLCAFYIALTGIQYATSGGDPQRIAQARSSFFGVMLGILILGMAFVIPRILNEVLIEPVGGARLASSYAYGDCDEILKSQLIYQQGAVEAGGMNLLVKRIQSRFDDICYPDIWDPAVVGDTTAGGVSGLSYDNCFIAVPSGPTINGVLLPTSLRSANGSEPSKNSRRDLRNNILVYFGEGGADHLPFGGSHCWIYFSGLDAWYDATAS